MTTRKRRGLTSAMPALCLALAISACDGDSTGPVSPTSPPPTPTAGIYVLSGLVSELTPTGPVPVADSVVEVAVCPTPRGGTDAFMTSVTDAAGAYQVSGMCAGTTYLSVTRTGTVSIGKARLNVMAIACTSESGTTRDSTSSSCGSNRSLERISAMWPMCRASPMPSADARLSCAPEVTVFSRSAPARRAPARAGQWFYVGIAIVAVTLSVAAFAPSIVNQSERLAPLTPVVATHASFMAAWLGPYFVQAWLVPTRRIRWHKRLGMASILVAAGVVVSGYEATVAMARRGYDLSGDLSRAPGGAVSQTVFQFGGVLIFAVLVGAALLLRHRPEVHKRLMTLAVIQTAMGAPLVHLVGHFGLPGTILPAWGIVVVVVLIAHDLRVRGRIHPTSLGAGIGLVLLANAQAAIIGPSQAWQRLVAWLIR
jgi:hypothetical protein